MKLKDTEIEEIKSRAERGLKTYNKAREELEEAGFLVDYDPFNFEITIQRIVIEVYNKAGKTVKEYEEKELSDIGNRLFLPLENNRNEI